MGRPKGCKPVTQWGPGKPPPKSPGKPPLPPEVKQIRALTREAYILAFSKYLTMPIDEIKTVLSDGKTQMLDAYMCKCLVEGAKTGNYGMLNQMLDRIIGPVPVKIDGDIGDKKGFDMSQLTKQDLIAIVHGQSEKGTDTAGDKAASDAGAGEAVRG